MMGTEYSVYSMQYNANELTWEGTVQQFVGPEPALGVSWQNIRIKIKCWKDKQHMAIGRGLTSIQRKAQKFILGPSLTAKTR